MDCTWDASLLRCSDQLPAELIHIIQHGDDKQYLQAFTRTALDARYTYTILTHCENFLAHICASLCTCDSLCSSIAALGRIVPHAPHLSPYAARLLTHEHYTLSSEGDTDEDLLYLLGIFRLLRHDRRVYHRLIRPSELSAKLGRSSGAVAYLIIRILQICLQGSDQWLETAVRRFIGVDDPQKGILGLWDEAVIDYRFLSLWEEDRHDDIRRRIHEADDANRSAPPSHTRQIKTDLLYPSTSSVAGVLLPNPTPTSGAVDMQNEGIVRSFTLDRNLGLVAKALRSPGPVLLRGLAGSGKTLIINHLAAILAKYNSMITLHLNEQSDAKLLLGVHTTGDSPGTFLWKPGVLTTAVQEGRWVLIEDLDRAPNDVLGTILPLIERGQLFLPNRQETIHAVEGFRIFATVRTSVNHKGEHLRPLAHMLGGRHWNVIDIDMPSVEEQASIARTLYPGLVRLLPQLTAVYQRILDASKRHIFVGQNKGGSVRAISPQDLLKLCRRVTRLIADRTSFSSHTQDEIYLEAVECFIGGMPEGAAKSSLTAIVAEELHIDPQRRDHVLSQRNVLYRTEKTVLAIGRYSFSRARETTKKDDTFSTNPHTLRMLERVAATIANHEPLLLVGETGVGKTTAVQHLAALLGKTLVPFNLSQQSEAGDLLGGFKPVNARTLVIPLQDEFAELFKQSFSSSKNEQFLQLLGRQIARSNWQAVCKLWRQALSMVEQHRSSTPPRQGEAPSKKRKVGSSRIIDFTRWDHFASAVARIEQRLSKGDTAVAFTFIEGNIVRALRNGDWVLLDEINLASSDTLESIVSLFDAGSPSLLLTEAGHTERIRAHPDFRVIAAMNPATDVGKKDLPPGIRSRFTELYVDSPDRDVKSLQSIVRAYLREESASDPTMPLDVSLLYQKIIALAEESRLVDGAGQRPHFSLRTLTRTLTYARSIQQSCLLRRALYEGFQMSFLTFLDAESTMLVQPLLELHLFGKRASLKSDLRKALRKPTDGGRYAQGHPNSKHWIRQGSLDVEEQPHYIITPFVERNLENLVRATSTRQFPVLIQGPTSSGKTSMVEYLAKRTGHRFVRINNHEHTDLQEYLGTYTSGSDGRLTFQEGILVRALREGHWIVLDELNLAPTDVLEALNRLLDDNRELLIPETQETVRPHPDFMLFATQNPAGLYGGRKTLSRAFRNRFLELHFDDIPVNELQEILHRRTLLPETWCTRIVTAYKELSLLRQENRMFEQKSFATLRDLFRWAQRQNDSVQQLAANGFMLLCERVRKPEERVAIKSVLERVMSTGGPRIHIDEDSLYGGDCPEIRYYKQNVAASDTVWTKAMCRLYVLVSRALERNEPVLLVGETGCGKTTVCQMFADALRQDLNILNAHQNTETGDLIGSQRPLRNRSAIEATLRAQLLDSLLPYAPSESATTEELLRLYDDAIAGMSQEQKTRHTKNTLHLEITATRTRFKALFEWVDGTLVQAMRQGHLFLLDEISLADDSVLERMNSVLESQRTVFLAEKGSLDAAVTATDGFQFFATMNPGGDYGKRELSPALRNRFTEIWVPALSDLDDVLQIVQAKLESRALPFAQAMVDFAAWFKSRFDSSTSTSVSIRDVLAWVSFVNRSANLDPQTAIMHGAALVYIDTLGANPAGLTSSLTMQSLDSERGKCMQELGRILDHDAIALHDRKMEFFSDEATFGIGPFNIPRTTVGHAQDATFAFDAPTTASNAMRVLRALQVSKPILLEGSPGVGKTALITAIAAAAGMSLTRINLSDQTDLLDLFGSDVPVEGAVTGAFVWRDAPFLRAMKLGEWVLLDEMNLASQPVLEGLNAVLDHRGEVFVPELGQTFQKHPDFRLFAAQNPHHQGGGRKGLPASFVNRFTVVYADSFSATDLNHICKRAFPSVQEEYVKKVVAFVTSLNDAVSGHNQFGSHGGPWEFNLRDISRWLALASSEGLFRAGSPRDFADLLFVQRFRTDLDKSRVAELFATFFDDLTLCDLFCNVTARSTQVGLALLPRDKLFAAPEAVRLSPPPSHAEHLQALSHVMVCVTKAWPIILSGPAGVGKTALVEQIASHVGARVVTLSMSAETDAMDLIGGYEQYDPRQKSSKTITAAVTWLHEVAKTSLARTSVAEAIALLQVLEAFGATSWDPHELLKVVGTLPAQMQSIIRSFLEDIDITGIGNDKACFEWIDGPLIEALERGSWLVLDNANLCNPAVLDRLNSLLEPNGALIVNEHAGKDGQARVLQPHPDFRIFLTADPRVGELSRAMRNRAVELYLSPSDTQALHMTAGFSNESAMARFRVLKTLVQQQSPDSECLLTAASDHFALSDRPLIPRLQLQLRKGLFAGQGSTSLSLPHFGDDAASNERVSQLEGLYEEATRHIQVSTDLASVQTFHALNNQPLIQASRHCFQRALSLAAFHDFEATLCLLVEAITASRSDHALSERLTRFSRQLDRERKGQRSQRISMVDRLETMARAFGDWLRHALTAPSADIFKIISVAHTAMSFCSRLLQALRSDSLDPVDLYALAVLGREIVVGMHDTFSPDIESVASRFAATLEDLVPMPADTRVGTFVSLWSLFQSGVPASLNHLADMLAFEKVVDHIDTILADFTLPIDQIVEIRMALQQALETAHHSGTELRSLTQRILGILPSGKASERNCLAVTRVPHFKAVFELICRHSAVLMLRDTIVNNSESLQLGVLAMRPTARGITYSKGTSPGTLQHRLRLLSLSLPAEVDGSEDELIETSILGNIDVLVVNRLAHIDNVTLGNLGLLEAESKVLGRIITSKAHSLQAEPLVALDHSLYELLQAVLKSVGSFQQSRALAQRASGLLEALEIGHRYKATDVPTSNATLDEGTLESMDRFERVVQYLKHSLESRACSLEASATAWANFALASLELFVPSIAYDPVREGEIRLEIFQHNKGDLSRKLRHLQSFREAWIGQRKFLRARILEEEITSIGCGPEGIRIVRPRPSQVMSLFAEMQTMMRVLQPLRDCDLLQLSSSLLDESLWRNISGIQQRLRREQNRAYTDITDPLLGLIDCLRVAAHHTRQARHAEAMAKQTNPIANITPLMSASLDDWLSDECFSLALQNLHTKDENLQWLSLVAARSAVVPTTNTSAALLSSIKEVFRRFYDAWRNELQRDQRIAAARSSLYRYQDDSEVMHDDFLADEIEARFPTYDARDSPDVLKPSSIRNSQALAPHLATLYHAIWCPTRLDDATILDLVRDGSRFLRTQGGLSELPAVVLLLDDHENKLSPTRLTPSDSDVYFDSNIGQARILVRLVSRTRERFVHIQQQFPDNTLPNDVLVECDKVLKIGCAEPLAKFFPHVEQLHDKTTEWQKVASSQFSAADLLDDMVGLVVDWRRLELTSWNLLFDHEDKTCRRSAMSWWYVAYESIVEACDGLELQSESMGQFTQSLTETLGSFLTNCGMGEFACRIGMLRDFAQDMANRALSDRAVIGVQTALENIIAYYSAFQDSISEALARRRSELNKEVKNIIQLFAWKTRNIRDMKLNAKASHTKLFRVLRKYRKLLSDPVTSHLQVDYPKVISKQDRAVLNPESLLQLGSFDNIPTRGLSELQIKTPVDKLDVAAAIRIMQLKARFADNGFQGPGRITGFLHGVQQESTELRKATPATLTEANKSVIAHLKRRKRRLLADVLRETQIMGFKASLGEDVLASQRSLYTILARASSPLARYHATQGVFLADEEFYRMLHVMQSVRESASKHSEDLTPNEVKRCTALLESMLHTCIKQRATLDAHLSAYTDLRAIQVTIERLALCQDPLPRHDSLRRHEKAKAAVASFAAVLQAGIRCLRCQSSLSGISYQPILESLEHEAEDVRSIHAGMTAADPVTPAFSDCNVRSLEKRYNETLTRISTVITGANKIHPELEPVLSRISRFFGCVPLDDHEDHGGTVSSSRKTRDEPLQNLLDAMQRLVEDHDGPPRRVVDPATSSEEQVSWVTRSQDMLAHEIESLGLERHTTALQQAFGQASESVQILDMCTNLHPLLVSLAGLAQAYIAQLLTLHQTTSQLTHQLGTTFVQLSREGFCGPSDKGNSDDKQSGEAQAGTGLGDGEGAEDISKDIADDEDLSELAQEAQQQREGEEIEAEKDAVDMADEDLAGELGEAAESDDEQNSTGDEKSDVDVDEEVGEVNDQDASAVDEKQWDASKDDKQPEKDGAGGEGRKADDVAAADEDGATKDDEQPEQDVDDDSVEAGDETEASSKLPEQADAHLEEEETLQLPEDLTMDDNNSEPIEGSDQASDLDDAADQTNFDDQDVPDEVQDQGNDDAANTEEIPDLQPDAEAIDAETDPSPEEASQDNISDVAMLDHQEDDQQRDANGLDSADDGQGQDDSHQTNGLRPATKEAEDHDDSEVPASQPGQSERQSGLQNEDQDDQQGATGSDQQHDAPFKQLGDVLKQWYDQHRDIAAAHDGPEEKDSTESAPPIDDMKFQHVSEYDESMLQALGAASADQSKALDDANAMAVDEPEDDSTHGPYELPDLQDDSDQIDLGEGGAQTSAIDDTALRAEKTMIGASSNEPVHDDQQSAEAMDVESVEGDDQLLANEGDSFAQVEVVPLSTEEARRQWSGHEARTRTMAVVLTEHLRLILQPTQATKMRGDFRTGKRLNIKKIIPYIASSYKRDKIWMRRSVPSKRSYQIMLALDDSESMTERRSKVLAFDTLALVAKSMTMLEAGEISIVGFGEGVNVAHDFSVPFTNEAGGEVVKQFTFSQSKTDVRKLLERSIDIFREARLKAMGSASKLWQLQLIISDGDCEDHASIRRLVRQAQEAQIMVVFVVIDASSPVTTGGATQSIVDLQRAEFSKDAKGELQVEMVKYLETFPFRYYLIVRDVVELPSVLAGALRQWFAEVTESDV